MTAAPVLSPPPVHPNKLSLPFFPLLRPADEGFSLSPFGGGGGAIISLLPLPPFRRPNIPSVLARLQLNSYPSLHPSFFPCVTAAPFTQETYCSAVNGLKSPFSPSLPGSCCGRLPKNLGRRKKPFPPFSSSVTALSTDQHVAERQQRKGMGKYLVRLPRVHARAK